MKCFILIALVLFQLPVLAQKSDMYVALKSGLSIRDKPNEGGKVMGKIPYGTKLSIAAGATTKTRMITEGLYGYWTKVTFGQ